jgi:NDP-sugar pyrophosphorylase family protein
MKAIVLAGGEGTRLRPLTWTTPKPLLPIVNRPFLEHQLSWLAGHGVTEVVLSLGYRSDAFAGRSFSDLPVQVAAEPEPLGTAGAIRFAAEVGGVTSRFLVCNGDVLTDLDVSALVRFHEEREAEATIALTRVDDPSAFGVVPTDDDGRVLRFVEKPPPGEAPTDWINAGTYVLEPSVIDDIPAGRAVSIEREIFPGLLARKGRLYALPSAAYWLDIGTPAKYLEANADRLERSGAGSLIGPGAAVAPGAAVDGSVLGAGVVVEAGAKVVRSVLFDGARIGAGAEVTDSVVAAGAVVEAGAAVSGVSIVGPGAVVAPGERLAGARVEAGGTPGAAG